MGPVASCGELLQSIPWGQIVIVEHEAADESEFLISTVNDVRRSRVLSSDFSGDGCWRDEPVEICISRLANCRTGGNYTNFDSRYFQRRPHR